MNFSFSKFDGIIAKFNFMGEVLGKTENTMSLSHKDLLNYFIQGEKPPSDHKIGMEYELFGLLEGGKPLPFKGEPGVESTLEKLAQLDGWKIGREQGHALSLNKGKKSVFLEPGGQIELSTQPYQRLTDLNQEIQETLSVLLKASQNDSIDWIALGLQPVSLLDHVGWIPKERYSIMSRSFEKHGSELAHTMMKQTASIQINVDYSSEADALKKFKLLTAIAPITTAIFANSSIYENRAIPFESYRGYVWQHTDPLRCGIIPEVFNPNYSYEEYLDFILHIPMLFIKRDDEWIEVLDRTFAQFLEKGFADYEATLEDWNLHLSTIFTEVRLKQVLELRSADSHLPNMAMGVAAFVDGLLFDPSILDAAWDCVKDWTWEERLSLYHEVPKAGLRARVKNDKISTVAGELLRLSQKGLSHKEKELKIDGEAAFLEPVVERVEKGESLSEKSSKEFEKDPLKWLQTKRISDENGI